MQYIWFGLLSFQTRQWSPEHQGNALDEELNVYLELLFEGSNELGGKENTKERTEPAS